MSESRLAVIALLLLATVNIGESQHPLGRPLTPEEKCGHSEVQNTRIVGGGPSRNGQWPWVALLVFKDAKRGHLRPDCGGSLITSRHVLTAAHCISHELSFVRLGEYDMSTDVNEQHDDFGIAHVEMHKDYDKRLSVNDIAILYLEEDVKFNKRIWPVCLPLDEPHTNHNFVDMMPFVAGWGNLKHRGQQPTVMNHAQLPIIHNDRCRESYQKINEVVHPSQFDNRVICAGFTRGGIDSCQGDSGGPLMLPLPDGKGNFPYFQVGVVSWGIGCAQPNVPGVYVNVTHFARWIKEKLAIKLPGFGIPTPPDQPKQSIGDWIREKLGL